MLDIGTVPPAPTPVGAGPRTRVLPPDEWDKLLALPFGSRGLPDQTTSVVLVEEAEDVIIGVWSIQLQPMLDGLWVHPDHRHTLVAGHLLREMKALLTELGVRQVFTIISDPSVMSLAYKAGFERPAADLWTLTLPVPVPTLPEEPL